MCLYEYMYVRVRVRVRVCVCVCVRGPHPPTHPLTQRPHPAPFFAHACMRPTYVAAELHCTAAKPWLIASHTGAGGGKCRG